MPIQNGIVPIEVLYNGDINKNKIVEIFSRKQGENYCGVATQGTYPLKNYPFVPGTYDFKVVGENEQHDEIEAVLEGVEVLSGQTTDIVQANYDPSMDESRGGFTIALVSSE